jgi:hypothetical protein
MVLLHHANILRSAVNEISLAGYCTAQALLNGVEQAFFE